MQPETNNDSEHPSATTNPNEANTPENTSFPEANTLTPEPSKDTDPNSWSDNVEPSSTPSLEQPLLPEHAEQSFFAKNKKIIIFAIVLLVLLAIGSVVLLTRSQSQPAATTTQKQSIALLGAEAAIVDGKAEITTNGKVWKGLAAGDKVATNSTIRTGADGRVVLALDDGSALRINNNSEVIVASLVATNIRFTNKSGEVYARVVPSERAFVVAVDAETYTAKGTAYNTINRPDTKGVEVYHSAVVVGGAKTEVAEGKRYYQANGDSTLLKKTTDIPTDQLSKDAFLAWNLEQDKKSTEFAKTLGYLTTLEQKQIEAAKKAAEPKPTTPTTPSDGILLSAIKTDSGIKLVWSVTGISAPKGFKVVKSLETNPTFGQDSAVYVDSSTARSYSWSLKDGKKYYFRVCVYTGEGCTNYSNNASAIAPLIAKPSYPTPTGTLTLSQVSGKNVEWTLNGSAPNGFKLVWSTYQNPTYGSSSAEYYGASATNGAMGADSDGTYYVRVCMYTGSGCINYSNQITITLP